MEISCDTGRVRLEVGGLSRAELEEVLRASCVLLNKHAKTLLRASIFDQRERQIVDLVEHTVGDLGLTEGAVLPQILAIAQGSGLLLCPPDTGPYLRMALCTQVNAPDSVISAARAPSGALTVASLPLSEDDEYPKGFYLRVVDGQPWLRGYRCDDQHWWSPTDRFVFCVPTNGDIAH